MNFEVFISANHTKTLISGGKAVIVDCRYSLEDPDWGYKSYLASHIPEAVYADLDKDLSGEITKKTGRLPLPTLEDFVRWVGNKGLSPEKKIIVYDARGGGIAARLWWMLTQLGYPEVYILDGGIQNWRQNHFKLQSGEEDNPKRNIETQIDNWAQGPYNIATMEDILKKSKETILVDSRAPQRFAGREEPYDPPPGRIPGARNYFWQNNLDENLMIKQDNTLNQNLLQVLSDQELANSLFYCGSGVTVCLNLAILAHLHKAKPSIYPGSYSEWVRNRPEDIETNQRGNQ